MRRIARINHLLSTTFNVHSGWANTPFVYHLLNIYYAPRLVLEPGDTEIDETLSASSRRLQVGVEKAHVESNDYRSDWQRLGYILTIPLVPGECRGRGPVPPVYTTEDVCVYSRIYSCIFQKTGSGDHLSLKNYW